LLPRQGPGSTRPRRCIYHNPGRSITALCGQVAEPDLMVSRPRCPGPPGFQRGHLPHPDRGQQCADSARRCPQWRQGGIEEQTRKLVKVCRLRDVPIITFVNKLDREGRDPFDLLDEIEQSLALDVTPASWPIGMGRDFLGTYDLFADALLLFERGVRDRVTEPVRCSGLDDPKLPRLLPKPPWPNCARRSRWRRGCARRSAERPTAKAICPRSISAACATISEYARVQRTPVALQQIYNGQACRSSV
jgi:hypothetical protein